MRFRTIEKIILSALIVASALGIVSCGKKNDIYANAPQGETYHYNYDRPLHAETDSFITMDGKLDEDVWKNQKYMEWECDAGKRKATTVFTEKGVYIGAYAEDKAIVHTGRHAVGKNTEYWIRIIKEDEVNYADTDVHHPQRQFMIQVDAEDSLSLSERQYDAAWHIEGEVNSGNTKSFSTEIFLEWSEMGYTKEELGEKGYPEAIRAYIEYRSPDQGWSYPGFVDVYRYSTYYTYNCDGIVQDNSSPYAGNAINGECATVDWKVDDKNKTVTSTANGGRTIFLKQDDEGNAISKATSFMLSTKVALEEGAEGWAWTGLLAYGGKNNLLIYTLYGDMLLNGDSLIVGSTRACCGNQWTGDKTVQKAVDTEYKENYATLKMYKEGANFYYFVNDTYVGMEYVEQLKGEAQVGFYSGLMSKFSDWHFVNYDGKEEELRKELGKALYFVTTETKGSGKLTTDVSVVKKGDELAITASPNPGNMLTSLTINGKEHLSSYISNVENGVWKYKIQKDATIKATYEALPKDALVDVKIVAVEKGTDTAIVNAPCVVTSSDSRLIYTGTTNEKGQIVLSLPKAGSYEVGKSKLNVSGNYTVYIEKDKLSTAKGLLNIPKSSDKNMDVTIEIGKSWEFVAWPGNNRLDNWKYDEKAGTVTINDDWGGALLPDADNITDFRASVTFGPIGNDGGQVGFEFCPNGVTDWNSSVLISVARTGANYVLRINQYQHNTLITMKTGIAVDEQNPCELTLERVSGIYIVSLNGKEIVRLDEDKMYNAQGYEVLSGYLNFSTSESIRLKDLITSNHKQLRFCAPMAGSVILYDWSFEAL